MSDDETAPGSGTDSPPEPEPGAGSAIVSAARPSGAPGDGSGRTSMPPGLIVQLADLAHKAIQAEERTQNRKAELEQEAYLEALKFNDAADARAVELDKIRVQGKLALASRRLSFVAGLGLAGLVGLVALGANGYVRETLEIVAVLVFSSMSFLTGREVGRRQERDTPHERPERESDPGE